MSQEKIVHLSDLDNKFAFVTCDSVPASCLQVTSTFIFGTNFKLFGVLFNKVYGAKHFTLEILFLVQRVLDYSKSVHD